LKKITLIIADDVYKELKSNQGVRMLTGSAYGIQDAFIVKLIEAIDRGDKEANIEYRKKSERKRNSKKE
jgi:hypothetical protein